MAESYNLYKYRAGQQRAHVRSFPYDMAYIAKPDALQRLKVAFDSGIYWAISSGAAVQWSQVYAKHVQDLAGKQGSEVEHYKDNSLDVLIPGLTDPAEEWHVFVPCSVSQKSSRARPGMRVYMGYVPGQIPQTGRSARLHAAAQPWLNAIASEHTLVSDIEGPKDLYAGQAPYSEGEETAVSVLEPHRNDWMRAGKVDPRSPRGGAFLMKYRGKIAPPQLLLQGRDLGVVCHACPRVGEMYMGQCYFGGEHCDEHVDTILVDGMFAKLRTYDKLTTGTSTPQKGR